MDFEELKGIYKNSFHNDLTCITGSVKTIVKTCLVTLVCSFQFCITYHLSVLDGRASSDQTNVAKEKEAKCLLFHIDKESNYQSALSAVQVAITSVGLFTS